MQYVGRNSPIASAVAKCLESFGTLGKTLDVGGDDSQLQTALIDCRGRFRIWSGNIGAHQTGKSSLDHRLRDAPYISKSALQLLTALDALIADARSMITGLREPSDNIHHDSDSSDADFSEDEDEDAHRPSEIEQIFLDISELIASLYRLSMSIRNPTVTRRHMKASSFDTSAFESHDIEHVRQKFPGVPTYLACRLGKANSRRRQWLRYRELHAAKLTQGLDVGNASTALSETTASIYKSESELESKGGATMYESARSMSETSYATSTGASSKTRMPPMPKEAKNEQPFECPYCHAVECVKHSHAWIKHVYSDLQPYVCTFEDCTSPTETYESRHAWFNHELQNHRRTWTCNGHCTRAFITEDAMVAHIRKFGDIALTSSQASVLTNMCINPIDEAVESKCPMCDLIKTGICQLRKHLGGHLEELALFTLPVANADSDTEHDSMASSNEVDQDTEMLIPKKDDKRGQEDSTDIRASALLTETNDPQYSPSVETLSGNHKESVSYKAYNLTKLDPDSWVRVKRTPIHLSQEVLHAEVINRKASAFKQYTNLAKAMRGQVDRLIKDRNSEEMDLNVKYKLAAMEIEKRNVGKYESETVSIQVILRRRLQHRVTQEAPNRLNEPGAIVDLSRPSYATALRWPDHPPSPSSGIDE